jgi:phenylacetate-CoA ligase
MIRLELGDQVTVLGDRCPCGSAHRLVADVAGRAEDSFTYPDGVVVHPHLFRSVILREPSVVEYQVAQTPTGVDVRLVGAPADPGSIARAIAAGLADAGLPDPSVNVHIVDALQRQATGKVRRFISLAA